LKLQITIDGHAYAVDVAVLEDDESPELPMCAPHQAALPTAGQVQIHPGGAWDAAGNVGRSPVTGLVIKVNVTPEQAVEAGQLLLVLEAMKMETHVTAPRAGTVNRVHVVEGDPVKLDQVLIEFE
jgi:methylmalonyl-CoA carboxyltransferase small subunit